MHFLFRVLLFDVATLPVPVCIATSGDSARLVPGMTSTDGIHGLRARVKLAWGLLVSGLAVSLLLGGGLQAVQMATLVLALFFTLVALPRVAAPWRGVRADRAVYERHGRVPRRLLEDLSVGSHVKPQEQP